jgi:hypothetical protein
MSIKNAADGGPWLLLAIGYWVLGFTCAEAVQCDSIFGRDAALSIGKNFEFRKPFT